MKNLLLIFIVCLTLSPSFFVFAQVVPVSENSKVKNQFRVGEKLTYSIAFANYSSAGYAELQSTDNTKFNGRNVIQLRTRILTLEPIKTTLYNLNYEAATLIDPQNGETLRFRRSLSENNENPVVFESNAAGSATIPNSAISAADKKAGAGKESAVPSTVQVFDILSAIYRLRSMIAAENVPPHLRVQEGAKIYDLELKSSKGIVPTALGTKTVTVLAVRTNDENFNKLNLQISLTDDEQRLPVLITFRLPKGAVRAEIASAMMNEPPAKPTLAPTPTPTPRPIIRPTPRPIPQLPKYEPNAPLDAELPFALGEKLNFKVFLPNQPNSLGTITLTAKERNKFVNGQDGVLLAATVSSAENANTVFNLPDTFNSYVSPESLLPQKTEVRLTGNLAKFNQTLNFNQSGGIVVDEKAASFAIPGGTFDFLALAYAIRTFRFTPKDVNKVAFFAGNTSCVLTIALLQRETLEINGQKVSAMQISIKIEDTAQPDKYQLRLWLSDDAKRLPLRFTAATPLGQIRAELQVEIAEKPAENNNSNE